MFPVVLFTFLYPIEFEQDTFSCILCYYFKISFSFFLTNEANGTLMTEEF